ncbi:MAG: M16 family metallopeptidase [Armatimonadota bacterium]
MPTLRPALRVAGIIILLLLGLAARAGSLPNPFPAGCIITRVLPNGLRIVVREDHSLPIVSMVVVVRGGSGAGDVPGAAHYLEHLALQGTKRYPDRLAPQYALEKVGGVSEAVTSRDMTRYQATVESSHAPLLVEVLADVATAALLDDESFARERPTVLSEIQGMTDDPQALLLNLGYQHAYRVHPYRARPTGTLEDVLRLTAADVRGCYQRRYQPNNMSVVLVGDITSLQAFKLVEAAFGSTKAAALPPWPGTEPAGREAVEGHVPTDLDGTYQVLAFPAPPVSDLDGVAAADLLMTLLASNGDGLLLEQWTKDGIQVYDFGVEFVSARGPGRLMIWALTRPAQAAKLRASTTTLLTSLAAHPVSTEMLARAKDRLAADLLLQNETYSQQASTLAFYEGLDGAIVLTRYIPAVEALTAARLSAAVPTRPLAWITLGQRPEEGR